MQNRSRYDTLNISMQTDNVSRPRRAASELNRTIDVSDNKADPPQSLKIIEQHEQSASNQAKYPMIQASDKYFQQLYRKNEELRRQLKSISLKLTEQIERVKFNPLRKSSAAAPTENKADKGIKRELENAYRQVAMYKKQIATLKAKEETQASFDKLKDLENLISFRDTEIVQLQSQLKSVKAVKAMQEKKLEVDVENEEVQGIMSSYAQESKELKGKLKELAARDRKREENYKKQQAYQIEVERRLREVNQVYHPGTKKEEPPKPPPQEGKEVSDEEWRIIKTELEYEKGFYKQLHKKIETMSKLIKKERLEKEATAKLLEEKEERIKVVKARIAEMKKLVKAHEKTTIDNMSDKQEEPESNPHQPSTVQQENVDATYKSTASKKKPKEWNGQQHLEQKGFAAKEDTPFSDKELCDGKDSRIVGISLQLDDDNEICTLQATYEIEQETIEGEKSSEFVGTHLQWNLQNGDYVKAISGAFSNKGSLEHLVLQSKNGKTGRFGNVTTTQKTFMFEISEHEIPKYLFGATHKFGKDVRVSMLGACIGPERSN